MYYLVWTHQHGLWNLRPQAPIHQICYSMAFEQKTETPVGKHERIACFMTHCFKWGSYLSVQSLFNLMQTFFTILTLQENIFDVHHVVDFPMTVDNMTVANVSHSASMTHSCMHHYTINILIHSMHTPCFIDKTFPATVATVKCPSECNICGHSYNCLTFNGWISLCTIIQCTKTEENVQC